MDDTRKSPASQPKKFWSIDKEIAKRKDLTPTEKLIWGLLNDYQRLSNRNGRKHPNPGIRRIADDLGLPKSTISRSLLSLKRSGLIDIINGFGRATNQYVIKCNITDNSNGCSVPVYGTQNKSVVSHSRNVVSHLDDRSVPLAGRTNNYNQEQRPRTPLYPPKRGDAQIRFLLIELFFEGHKSNNNRTLNRQLTKLLDLTESPDEVRERYKRWPEVYDVPITLSAFVRHWHVLKPPPHNPLLEAMKQCQPTV